MHEQCSELRALAEAVRSACLTTATGAYEDAGLQGLCAEGRFERALDAVRELDLDRLVRATLAERASEEREITN